MIPPICSYFHLADIIAHNTSNKPHISLPNPEFSFILYNILHVFSTFREKFVYSVQKSKDRLGIARRSLGWV